MDSPVPESFWNDTGLSAQQELQLYFKIVACHASHLSSLFSRRASQFIQLQEGCRLCSKRLLDMSNLSLVYYHVSKSSQSYDPLDYRHKLRLWATSWLKGCIKQYRILDSFCRIISPQPGMENLLWDMIWVESPYEGERRGIAVQRLMTIIDCATTWFDNARNIVLNKAGTIPDFFERAQDCSITRIEGLSWNFDPDVHSQPRQWPRDVELELFEYDPTHRSYRSTTVNGQSEITSSETTSTIAPPLQADLLVSVNNGRPKKKKVIIYPNRIVVIRGTRTRTTWAINANKLLLVTRRKTVNQTATLTVFFGASMDPVESIEMGFDDLELLDTWHARLVKLGPGYMSPKLSWELSLPSETILKGFKPRFPEAGTANPEMS